MDRCLIGDCFDYKFLQSLYGALGERKNTDLQSFLSTLKKEIVLQGPQNMKQDILMFYTTLQVSEPLISIVLVTSAKMPQPYQVQPLNMCMSFKFRDIVRG